MSEATVKAFIDGLNDVAEAVLSISQAKGFWEKDKEHNPQFAANLHGEVSELWEAYRKQRLQAQCDKTIPLTCQEEELADIIIHALEYAAFHNIDIEKAIVEKSAYNATRGWRHGGKVA